MPKVDAIPIGTLLPDSTAIEGPDRPWRFGLIRTATGDEAVFATTCDGRELFIQGIVASVARALGLPVPPCFIVLASKVTLPDHPSDLPFFMFACKAGPHPTLSAFARNIATVSDILLNGKRETANRMIVLDEWTKTPARDRTAALVDPQAGLQFVDHHTSLPDSAKPAEQLRNWVFEVASEAMTELDTARLRKDIQASASHIFDIDLGAIADQMPAFGDKAMVATWLGMLDYLATRRHHLEELFCKRLNIPDGHLPLNP